MSKPEITNFFQEACDRFTASCREAADWKDQYVGSTYSTRLSSACLDLEKAITEIRAVMNNTRLSDEPHAE